MQPDIELLKDQVDALFKILEELVKVLRNNPTTSQSVIVNSALNDFYLIRRGVK